MRLRRLANGGHKFRPAGSEGSFSLRRVLRLNLVYGCRVWKIIRTDKPEVFHAHDLTTLPAACTLPLLMKARVVYDSHELFLESGLYADVTGWRKWIMKSVEGLLARTATAIITVNETIASERSLWGD